ncbi:MAG: 4a-hydroxytetrahydrobiopterin dehydratase [Methylocella sp.]
MRRPRTGNSATTLIVSSGPSGSAAFREAGTFVQKIGELAEAEGHHPDISFGWGYATVGLQTKKIKGLHENDFIMATKIDQIFDRSTKNPSR